ncbi:MAG: nitrite reductase (NAD(P)H) small subunit [Ignavibacteriaceae bacterium]|nr:nitrite reductase (NAD(P)H) small subunit [Ignavibacterium sp.]MCC6256093.1 nitrite reductase (NAD(P)H) small subunit [Ignavibacteriaceae bacterium]HRP92776.1 nitrite reductase (NAD(P)H) small subunit [Ignavibacteriaceae bacterium]HRQ55567.1 nitrite reductase (NAD(P)H) small subunit [Ignavibacteriaceae bacterium]
MKDGYTRVCTATELKENQGKRFLINDVDVAVFKVNEEIFILSNICPHQHTANIYDGFLEDGCVVCPAHGWMFNLKTGKQPTGASGLDTYPIKIIDDEVFALVKPKQLKW